MVCPRQVWTRRGRASFVSLVAFSGFPICLVYNISHHLEILHIHVEYKNFMTTFYDLAECLMSGRIGGNDWPSTDHVVISNNPVFFEE